jgi:hypothetical protein
MSAKAYELEPIKLDRKKLYGWSETLILDENGSECQVSDFLVQNSLFLPKGSFGLGALDANNNWVEKNELKAVNANGEGVIQIPSSFDSVITLDSTVSIEEYLEYAITSVYSLQGEENCPDFVERIKNSKDIFTFDFNYRASYEPDKAFILESAGELFVLVGKKTDFNFIGLAETALLDDEDTESETDDELDFSMM